MRTTILSVLPIFAIVIALAFAVDRTKSHEGSLKVLTYSAFLNSWGPGPLIAQKFFEATGHYVEFIDGGDANLLAKKRALFETDVILGLDQFSPREGRWASPFEAIDWAPMTIIYRRSETTPPKQLDDLLEPRFNKKLSISDPRTSTPGLQFLIWIYREKGLEFVKKLKNAIGFVGPSWSSSYGYFSRGQSQLAFSYVTSPIYHLVEEKNDNYAAADLREKLPVQIEYAVIPAETKHLELAQKFISFLKSDEIQKIIMQKNFMLPLKKRVAVGTPFENISSDFVEEPQKQNDDIQKLLDEWQVY